MTIDDIYAQIEEEITWRRDEIRFLKNQLQSIHNDNDKKRYRKSLIVMLYSHYEGFCKTAFQIYVKAINDQLIPRNDANCVIKAASLGDVFKAYGNSDKKNEYFKTSLPTDEKLHIFSRQVDFVATIDALWAEKVRIPEDIVDTESNLKPVVMKKLLFRLGFEFDSFLMYEGLIHQLLNKRNSIAHGAEKSGVEENIYNDVEGATFTIMNELKKLIMDALDKRKYLKASS
ncbi:MAG: MAE_28990/MAE_18760 family HEPN-like nuclease [Paenibacillaceae bacterium]